MLNDFAWHYFNNNNDNKVEATTVSRKRINLM